MSESKHPQSHDPNAAGAGQKPTARPNLPHVEIFANQLPILIYQGETKEITLTGAVYDRDFYGTIKVEPNGPVSTACPIYSTIANTTRTGSLPLSANEPIITVVFTCPRDTAPGDYNCALKYTATAEILNVGNFSVGKGNQVNVGYTVKRKRR